MDLPLLLPSPSRAFQPASSPSESMVGQMQALEGEEKFEALDPWNGRGRFSGGRVRA